MIITPKNLVKHELTGLKVEVINSSDKNKIGIQGTVVNESKGIITIETSMGEKKVPKKECVFRFTLDETKVDVKGENLIGRPEERIKKQQTEKW